MVYSDVFRTQLKVAVKNHIRKLVVAPEVAEMMVPVVDRCHAKFDCVEVVGCQLLSEAIPHMFDL